MNCQEFTQKVHEQLIANGTIFNVLDGEEKIGQVGVIRTTIVYLEFNNSEIPNDILTGNYLFEMIEGE